jgi:hypothetical protein
MKSKVSTKDREAFALRVREVIRQAGGQDAADDDTGLYPLVIADTVCGPLYLHVADAGSHGLGFVAGRFIYPDRAVAVLGAAAVNQYSGKWNHHYWGTATVDAAVADFEWSLKRVLGVGDGGADVSVQQAL